MINEVLVRMNEKTKANNVYLANLLSTNDCTLYVTLGSAPLVTQALPSGSNLE
jgi:hypothetical protein